MLPQLNYAYFNNTVWTRLAWHWARRPRNDLDSQRNSTLIPPLNKINIKYKPKLDYICTSGINKNCPIILLPLPKKFLPERPYGNNK